MIDLFWIVLLPIIIAAVGMLLSLKIAKYLMVLLQLLMVVFAFNNFLYVKENGMVIQNIGGWPDYVGIALRADLLAVVMVLLTTILFLGMVIFNIKKEYVNNLFLFLFIVLEGVIIGVFLSNDLFNLFVLIEVSTVIISILIMFKRDSQAIYDGILYLLINVVAMSFFLFGTGILYKTLGVIDLEGIETAVSALESPDSMILPYAFIITSISLKAALMPLFSWLPKAHGTPSAPSIISAILSGLYVKSGVYLFIRVQEAFSLQIDTMEIFMIMGFLTAVIGFCLAILQNDIKLILAYSTVSQIGLIMMALNMGELKAYWGGIYHIINHALFKSILFLTAGVIVEEYKTRNIHSIRGVFRRMPIISLATMFAILGITGAPFFNGSISKYWIAYGAADGIAEKGIMLVNLGTIVVFVRYCEILFGKDASAKKTAIVDPYRNGVSIVLGLACFAGGIFGRQLIEFLFDRELTVDPISYGAKMLVFGATLILGIVLYYGFVKRLNMFKNVKRLELSFNGICFAITLFFSLLLIYLRITH